MKQEIAPDDIRSKWKNFQEETKAKPLNFTEQPKMLYLPKNLKIPNL